MVSGTQIFVVGVPANLIHEQSKAGDLDGTVPVSFIQFSQGIPQVDELSSALIQVDNEHHELHEGHHFFYTDKNSLDNGNTQTYVIITPDSDKWSHFIYIADGTAITAFDLYENTTHTGTTQQTLFNSNRNSSIVPLLKIYKGASTGGADGTLLKTYSSGESTGAAGHIPSGNRGEFEIILKQNTKYLFRITSGTNGNLTNFECYWYEILSGVG